MAMPDYRIYVLDKDGHIKKPPEHIVCPEDAAAIERAREHLGGQSIEVWDHARFVTRLEPVGSKKTG
jgi:hypothetical protein